MPLPGILIEYPQLKFSWRTVENSPSVVLKYTPWVCSSGTCKIFFRANGEMKPDASEDESEEENEEGDYTVYECPGLAPVSLIG